MMGILDDIGILEYGQVFVQYLLILGMEQEDLIVFKGLVVVMKNLCFYFGDL